MYCRHYFHGLGGDRRRLGYAQGSWPFDDAEAGDEAAGEAGGGDGVHQRHRSSAGCRRRRDVDDDGLLHHYSRVAEAKCCDIKKKQC